MAVLCQEVTRSEDSVELARLVLMLLLLLLIQIPTGFKLGNPLLESEYDRDQMYVVSSVNGELRVRSESGTYQFPMSKGAVSAELGLLRFGTKGAFLRRGTGTPYMSGELWGFDFGEWGGGLYYCAFNSTNIQEIYKSNVQAFGLKGDRIVVFSDSSHLDTVQGGMYEISWKGKSFEQKQLCSFSEPYSLACWNGSEFLVLNKNDQRMGKANQSKIQRMSLKGISKDIALFDAEKFRVESMTCLQDGTIWLGGLRFIARYNPNSKTPNWEFFVRNQKS